MEGNHPPSSSRIKCQPSFVCNKKFDGEGMKAVAEPGRMRGYISLTSKKVAEIAIEKRNKNVWV